MPDRRFAFSPGAERGEARRRRERRRAVLPCAAATRRLPQPYFFFCFVTWPLFNCHLASHGSTSSTRLALPISLPRTLSLPRSLSFSTRLTVASFLSFVSSFLPACCFRMLIFFRFLFWRPLPKHSDDPRPLFSPPLSLFLLLLRRFSFFLCLHTLLLVYRTNSSAHCRFACSCAAAAAACALPSARCPLRRSPSASAFADCDF